MGQCDFLLLFWTMLLGVYITGSDGLKEVRLDAPGYVRRGDSVTLTCKYDMERDTLYAVKWYRGTKEFYRYVPKEVPPIQVFPLQGINVDSQQSNEHDVMLVHLPLEISGKYKCVVSAETTFQTLFDIKELTVVAVGYGSPILSVDQQVFQGGESVNANCSIGQTSPQANITWYLDDQEVRPEQGSIRTFSIGDLNDTAVVTTMSMITFDLPETFTTIRLKCTGKLFDVYSESSIFDIRRTPPRRYSLGSSDTLLRSNSNSTTRGFAQHFHHSSGLIALLALAQLLLYFIKLKTAEDEML